jgi:hypothetical protein
MRIEPFAHIALVRAAFRRELGRRHGAVRGEHAIQAQPVAENYERRQRRGAEIGDGAA